MTDDAEVRTGPEHICLDDPFTPMGPGAATYCCVLGLLEHNRNNPTF